MSITFLIFTQPHNIFWCSICVHKIMAWLAFYLFVSSNNATKQSDDTSIRGYQLTYVRHVIWLFHRITTRDKQTKRKPRHNFVHTKRRTKKVVRLSKNQEGYGVETLGLSHAITSSSVVKMCRSGINEFSMVQFPVQIS